MSMSVAVENTDTNNEKDMSMSVAVENTDPGIIGSLEELLGAPTQDVQEHYINALGRKVYLRVPTAKDRGLFEGSVADKDRNVSTLKMRICSIVLCDEQGKLFVPDMKQAHIKLGKLSSEVVEEISLIAGQMLKISQQDIEDSEKK